MDQSKCTPLFSHTYYWYSGNVLQGGVVRVLSVHARRHYTANIMSMFEERQKSFSFVVQVESPRLLVWVVPCPGAQHVPFRQSPRTVRSFRCRTFVCFTPYQRDHTVKWIDISRGMLNSEIHSSYPLSIIICITMFLKMSLTPKVF